MSVLDDRPDVLDRFSTALYTAGEAARYLDVPASTLTTWAHGYHHRPRGRRDVVGAPILTTLPRTGARGPVIPFIGLAEGVVLTAMRRSGVPLQRIRPALEQLDAQFRALPRAGQPAALHLALHRRRRRRSPGRERPARARCRHRGDPAQGQTGQGPPRP